MRDVRVYEWTVGSRGGAHRDRHAAVAAVREALRETPGAVATLRTVRVDAFGHYILVDVPRRAIADGDRVHWRAVW